MTATERDADGREKAPAMTEHWRPRFGVRQMLVGNWALLGGAWWTGGCGAPERAPTVGGFDGWGSASRRAGRRSSQVADLARPRTADSGWWPASEH